MNILPQKERCEWESFNIPFKSFLESRGIDFRALGGIVEWDELMLSNDTESW